MEKRYDGRFRKGERRSPETEFKLGQHWRPFQIFRSKEWLIQEYEMKKRSTNDIAKYFNVTEGAILFWLRKHNIPRRSVADARKAKYWGAVGPANGMYGKRGPESPAYIDGSSPERAKIYARSEWRQLIHSIFHRDGYQCRICGYDRDLHAHHIKPWAKYPEFRSCADNLMTVCKQCHKIIHSKANKERAFLS